MDFIDLSKCEALSVNMRFEHALVDKIGDIPKNLTFVKQSAGVRRVNLLY